MDKPSSMGSVDVFAMLLPASALVYVDFGPGVPALEEIIVVSLALRARSIPPKTLLCHRWKPYTLASSSQMLTFDSDAQPFGATQEERTEEQILRGSSAEAVLDILRANWVMSILLVIFGLFFGSGSFPHRAESCTLYGICLELCLVLVVCIFLTYLY